MSSNPCTGLYLGVWITFLILVLGNCVVWKGKNLIKRGKRMGRIFWKEIFCKKLRARENPKLLLKLLSGNLFPQSFLMGQPRSLFCLFSFFSNTNSTEKNCRRQRDSNSDRRSRRQGPLDHHHGPSFQNLSHPFIVLSILGESMSKAIWRLLLLWQNLHKIRFSLNAKSLITIGQKAGAWYIRFS